MNSTNHGLKILEKNFPERFKKKNLNMPHAQKLYIRNIYIVFITIYIDYIVLGILSNLEMI